MIKLANSPTPPVEVERNCNAFLTSSITTPRSGPKAKAPMRAGKSDKSILAKEGDSGTGNSAKERAYAIAESRAAAVRVWALRAAGLFCCPSESVLFMFFLSKLCRNLRRPV